MLPAKNNIILIDCWEDLTHPLEILAKQNLQNFLRRIEGLSDWHVYVWNGNQTFDSQIESLIKNGKFKAKLEFDDPLQIYNTWHLASPVRYFFCGFHTNLCVFYNTVGIEKYLQIANKSQCKFWIVSDATMSLDLADHNRPCKTVDIPWYNPTQLSDTDAVILNYRNQIIELHSIESTNITIN
jgi:hypothetical protein